MYQDTMNDVTRSDWLRVVGLDPDVCDAEEERALGEVWDRRRWEALPVFAWQCARLFGLRAARVDIAVWAARGCWSGTEGER